MFTKTNIQVNQDVFNRAKQNLPVVDFKLALNAPSGRFLYDPWIIKEEFKNTVWEEVLNTLPGPIGEARIIVLKPGTGYQSHSDIDDRYHLNLAGDRYSYLVNVDENMLYPVSHSLFWYNMNAGPRHSAINLGKEDRIQLVVRKLLPKITFNEPINVTITPAHDNLFFRFDFDDVVSPWLNAAVKAQKISDFEFTSTSIMFVTNEDGLTELMKLRLEGFDVSETR